MKTQKTPCLRQKVIEEPDDIPPSSRKETTRTNRPDSPTRASATNADPPKWRNMTLDELKSWVETEERLQGITE